MQMVWQGWIHEEINAHTRSSCVKVTLWSSSVFTPAWRPPSYRFSEFRDGSAIGEGVAVTRVVHQHTRQEHGAQVVSIQNVHGQGGCRGSPVGWIRSSVLEEEEESNQTLKINLCGSSMASTACSLLHYFQVTHFNIFSFTLKHRFLKLEYHFWFLQNTLLKLCFHNNRIVSIMEKEKM